MIKNSAIIDLIWIRIKILCKSQVEIRALRENNILNKVTSHLIHLDCPNEFSSEASPNKW